MEKSTYSLEQMTIAKQLLRWTLLILPVSLVIGSLVALFLWLLDWATTTRWNHPWLLFLLPVAGIIIYFLYTRWGKNADAGNNLILDEIHEPSAGVPARMAPLILITTIMTHLFGGSAGREGTAVQIGGSMAAFFSRFIPLRDKEKRILLMCGMAAGFGAVFGTPVAGAVFALEVLVIGRLRYDALIPCLIASTLAHLTCMMYGTQHTPYHINSLPVNSSGWLSFLPIDPALLIKVIAGGILFGLAGYAFALITHTIKLKANQFISTKWLIPVTGGILVIAISYLLGTTDYLGLGVSAPGNGISILRAFEPDGISPFSWWWKLLLTAITLGMGFKGGEVTPLFFIGATLGHTIASFSGTPIDLFAALGFIAVFAGATNTPLACTLMGIELFGGEAVLYYAVACFTAYYFSGHAGIYKSQKIGVKKFLFTNPDA